MGGPAGAVVKARRALLAKARQPLVGGGARAAQLVGDIGGAVAGEDPLDQQPSSVNGEAGVTVTHEDLQVVKRQTPQCPEVFTRQRTVTNAMAGYT